MINIKDYQMAIDLLCCHLNLSEDEAKQQLGIAHEPSLSILERVSSSLEYAPKGATR